MRPTGLCVNFLDSRLEIDARNCIATSPYDKRKWRPDFGNTAKFPHIDSCLYRGAKFEVLDSQLIRFSRRIMQLRDFIADTAELIIKVGRHSYPLSSFFSDTPGASSESKN